ERVAADVGRGHRALGDDGAEEDERALHAVAALSDAPRARAASASSAGRITSSVSDSRTSDRRSEPGVRSSSSGRLAIARAAFSSISCHTNTVAPVSPILPSQAGASRVFICSPLVLKESTTRTRPAAARAETASLNAARRIFSGIRCQYLRPFGP